MKRTPVIAGNWKMNTLPAAGVALAVELKKRLADAGKVEIVVAPPFPHLSLVGDALKGSNIKLAAQNLYFEEEGAFTGEVSAGMIRAVGCEYVIIGHSERRQYFGETDASVKAKILAALRHEMTPIVCVGETLEEREKGKTLRIIEGQLKGALTDLPDAAGDRIIIAYEPVWAIGTGKTATNEEAQEVHAFIRKTLKSLFGDTRAETTRVLYGGSVKPENISGLMAKPDIDGALVGGASLKGESFEKIVKFRRD